MTALAPARLEPPRARAMPAGAGWALASGTVLLMLVLAALPPGTNASPMRAEWVEATQSERLVYDPPPLMHWGRALGQYSFLLLLASLALTHDFPLGRALRPRWRRRAHVALGAALLSLAAAHAVMLPLASVFRGWLSGAFAIAALAAHGLLGALRARLSRRLGTARWRWWHRASAWVALALVLEHVLLFGQHFGLLREVVYGH